MCCLVSISQATHSASTEELVWELSAGGCVVLSKACIVNTGGCVVIGSRGRVPL